MADAAAWFTEQLDGIAGAEARALLERRGDRAETARAFGLGFAPDSARQAARPRSRTYGDAMLVEAGHADPGRGQGARMIASAAG